MAYLENRNGSWMAQIRRKGWPAQSKSFETKAEAQAWARQIERDMDAKVFVSTLAAEQTTFAQVAERYRQEVLPELRGKDSDESRLKRLEREFGAFTLASITPAQVSKFQFERLKLAAPQTVLHEVGLMTRILRSCEIDWGIAFPRGIPTQKVRKPQVHNERDRRLLPVEEKYLLSALKDSGSDRANPWMHSLVVLAIETGARHSELMSLIWDNVNLKRRVARFLGKDGGLTKNNDPHRDVPLTKAAVKCLKALPRDESGKVFPMTANAAKLSWERAVIRARRNYVHDMLRRALGDQAESEISALVFKKRQPSERTARLVADLDKRDPTLVDLHFHDLRHEATSRFADKLQMHELMRVAGHKTSRMVTRYYHPKVEDLALKLD